MREPENRPGADTVVAASSGFTSLRFSTGDLPERERLPFFREVFARQISSVDVEPGADTPFHVEATFGAVPGLRMLWPFVSTPARQRRTPDLIADGEGDLALIVNLRGRVMTTQRGREVGLRAGDAVCLLHAEPSAMHYARVKGAAIMVPRAALAPLVANVEDAAMRLVPRDNEALRLLVGYVKQAQTVLANATPELRHVTVAHIHDLVAMALGANRDGTALAVGRGVRAARLDAVKADILQNLASPDLSAITIARRQGMTPRYVHLLFEAEGLTFSQYVIARRLEYAWRMLADPRYADMTIVSIALAAGFGDLSHFNRCFRRRFAATPRDIRWRE